MEPLSSRPWWRLEPKVSDTPAPTEISPELMAYHQAHYRDKAALDAIMWSPLDEVRPRRPMRSDPVGSEYYDPYGTPVVEEAGEAESWVGYFNSSLKRACVTEGTYREWFLSVATPQLLDRFADDESLAAAIPPNPKSEASPGSLIGIRHRGITSFFESVSNLVDRTNTLEHQIWSVGAGLRVYDGQLFWLPDPVGAHCVTSEAPDPDLVARIRLPFESVLVGLASPVPASALGDGDDETWRIGMAVDGTKGALGGEPHLAGVWMASGEDGFGVAPVVVWFVETDGGMTAVPGIWTRSAYAGAVANLGAVLTWESWIEPPESTELMGEAGSRERRKALKRGAVRRAIARGAFHRVRVLTFPIQATGSGDPGFEVGKDAGRRSPIRHWRRGHWTKVRVATRSPQGQIIGSTSGEKDVDWSYEGRWIHPVLVNPEGSTDPGTKVYKQVAAGSP
ncbi:MAG: hypothetical protein ABSA65_18205 [Acidimicrobiales bacterium]|jgi:hypothetical protein